MTTVTIVDDNNLQLVSCQLVYSVEEDDDDGTAVTAAVPAATAVADAVDDDDENENDDDDDDDYVAADDDANLTCQTALTGLSEITNLSMMIVTFSDNQINQNYVNTYRSPK